MGRDRYKFLQPDRPHFVTCITISWIPLFSNPDLAGIIIESLKYMHDNKRMAIHGWVLMENHIHLVATSDDLPKEIGIFKSFTARKIIDHLKEKNIKWYLDELRFWKDEGKSDRKYQVWQEGSHPVIMETWTMYGRRLNYIHNNPVKRGYVERPEHWRYSSAKDYYGQEKGLVPITKMERY